MNETVTINNEELAILCDLMSGWGVRKWAENPGTAKKQFERLLTAGCVELPTCQCGEDMEITGINEFPISRDAAIRVCTCPACLHEMRLTVWAPDQAA